MAINLVINLPGQQRFPRLNYNVYKTDVIIDDEIKEEVQGITTGTFSIFRKNKLALKMVTKEGIVKRIEWYDRDENLLFSGQILLGQPNGEGYMMISKDIIFRGKFDMGFLQEGKLFYKNEDKEILIYSGKWYYNIPNEYGTTYWSDGKIQYHGGILMQSLHGYGTYYSDIMEVSGIWNKGQLTKAIQTDKYNNTLCSGKVQLTPVQNMFRLDFTGNGNYTDLFTGVKIFGMWEVLENKSDMLHGICYYKQIHKLYEGELRNFRPHGFGTMYGTQFWPESSHEVMQHFIVIGIWENGILKKKIDQRGTKQNIIYINPETLYIGDTYKTMCNGQGVLYSIKLNCITMYGVWRYNVLKSCKYLIDDSSDSQQGFAGEGWCDLYKLHNTLQQWKDYTGFGGKRFKYIDMNSLKNFQKPKYKYYLFARCAYKTHNLLNGYAEIYILKYGKLTLYHIGYWNYNQCVNGIYKF